MIAQNDTAQRAVGCTEIADTETKNHRRTVGVCVAEYVCMHQSLGAFILVSLMLKLTLAPIQIGISGYTLTG